MNLFSALGSEVKLFLLITGFPPSEHRYVFIRIRCNVERHSGQRSFLRRCTTLYRAAFSKNVSERVFFALLYVKGEGYLEKPTKNTIAFGEVIPRFSARILA